MNRADELRRRLKTPRAAAFAGILFSSLAIGSHLLIRAAVPANPFASSGDLLSHAITLLLALNLVPFAGISFLWFIGVFRDHLGEYEERLFATVFFGSGLLYVAMLFASAALAGGLLAGMSREAGKIVSSGSYSVGRSEIRQITTVYGIRMAGVFIMTASTISLRTRAMPRWLALLGYLAALVLLLGVGARDWTPQMFPAWVFVISIWILIQRFRQRNIENPVTRLAGS
jgi:hypothetical protein